MIRLYLTYFQMTYAGKNTPKNATVSSVCCRLYLIFNLFEPNIIAVIRKCYICIKQKSAFALFFKFKNFTLKLTFNLFWGHSLFGSPSFILVDTLAVYICSAVTANIISTATFNIRCHFITFSFQST